MLGALITHRGIDIPVGKNAADFPMESTWEAFTAQIDAGFGLEFDIQLTADHGFAISHDQNLSRLSGGSLLVNLKDVPTAQISTLKVPGGRLCTLDELLEYMVDHAVAISALHLKARCQMRDTLPVLIEGLKPFASRLPGRLVIFDAAPGAARLVKEYLPEIALAASVSDPYDVKRYSDVTGGTLLTPETVLKHQELYSWVWLDEWDRKGADGRKKTLISVNTVEGFHRSGFKVAAVSPELHATSPSLLGREAHEDGASSKRLQERWLEWQTVGLDAVCTDHASWLRRADC